MDLWNYENMKIGKFGNKMERLAGWYGAGVLCTPLGCFFRNHFKMGCQLNLVYSINMLSYIRGNRENKLSEIFNSWSSAAGKAKIVIENFN